MDDATDRLLACNLVVELATLPGRTIAVAGETAETITLVEEGDAHLPELVAAGFHAENWQEAHSYNAWIIWVHSLELSKLDPRLVGPYRQLARHRGCVVRVVDTRPGEVLAVARASIGAGLGFRSTRHGDRMTYAWIARDEVELIALEDARTSVFDRFPLAHLLHEHLVIGFAPLGAAMEVESETAETIVLVDYRGGRVDELVQAGFTIDHDPRDGSYDHRLELRKDDRRLDGAFAWRRHRGALVRTIDELPGRVLAVAHHTLGMQLGFTRHEALAQRWILDTELEDPAPSPRVDATLRQRLERHTGVTVGGRALVIAGETLDSLTLDDGDAPLLALKGDADVTGAFLYWVRSGGQLLRVVAEAADRLLAVAHPELGAELGFRIVTTRQSRRVAIGWLAADRVQRL